MTSKFVNDLQTISLRPQNDVERIILSNIQALLLSGKIPKIHFEENGDMILEIKSAKEKEK